MSKILVIEQSKSLAKLIAMKINYETGFEVDVAYDFNETKLFLAKENYFFVVLDMASDDTQILEHILKQNGRVLVLSQSIDKEFRKSIVEKNIIDYVKKSGLEDINYIIQTIKRLQQNRTHKVLVVEDSVVFRKTMQQILENMFFQVKTVAHGEEALALIDDETSLVLTDYHMPVMDGLSLTKELRKTYSKNNLAIIVVSNNSDDETTALFLKNGANDYVKKPFSKEEFICRINNTIEALENIQQITNHSKRDFITGLYNRRYFFSEGGKYVEDALLNSKSFAVALVDIDDFRHINDTFGQDSGDKTIVNLADILRTSTSKDDIVARLDGDIFCMLLKDVAKASVLNLIKRIEDNIRTSSIVSSDGREFGYSVSMGIITNPQDGLEEVLNEAEMLLYRAKQSGKNKIEIE